MFKKENSNYYIESLQKIIDKQNKELSKLRWASLHIKEYEEKKKQLDRQISEYRKLSNELKSLIKKQKQLNQQLTENIYECKNQIKMIKNE